MINYIPARLSRPIMPKDADVDFNWEQEARDEEKIFDEQLEIQLYEWNEGGEEL